MKYCTQCGSEYRDEVKECVDCGNTELVAAEEMKRRGIPMAGQTDTRRFERAGIVDDQMTAEHLASTLQEENIPVFLRQRMGGTVDNITDSVQPYWEILVPDANVDRAVALIQRAKAELDATSDEAARAAEEEEAEGEKTELQPAGAKPV